MKTFTTYRSYVGAGRARENPTTGAEPVAPMGRSYERFAPEFESDR